MKRDLVSGKELAEKLGVGRSAVSMAVKEDRHCQDWPIHEWARRRESGRVQGYDVPPEACAALGIERESNERENPADALLSGNSAGSSGGNDLDELLKFGGIALAGWALWKVLTGNSDVQNQQRSPSGGQDRAESGQSGLDDLDIVYPESAGVVRQSSD